MKKSFVIAVALALVAICLIRFDLVAKQPAQAGRNAPTPAQQRPADQPPNRNVQSEPEVREKIPLDQLRYDGKSFGEWKHEWTTELKPERRAEAIEAFVAFGANGYGEEAARAIVEVMRMLDMTTTDATFTTHKYRSFRAQRTLSGTRLIKQTAMAAFLDTQSEYRIPTAPALEVLSEELKRGSRSGRLFAIFVLYNMGQKITPLIPDLIQTVQKDPDRTVRSYALTALAQVDPGSPVLASGLRNALKDPDEQALQRMLNTLCLTLLRPAGPNGKPLPNAEAIVQVLIDAVSSRHAVVRHQAILGLGRIGAAAEKALPTLVQALRTGDPDDRVVIAEVLPWFGPAAKQAEPALWEVVREDDEMRNRVAAFRAILSLNVRAEQHPGGKFTELAQKLDQRNPADLGMLYSAAARLGGSYREMAFSYLRDIAENADDEAARRAAQEALELARGSR